MKGRRDDFRYDFSKKLPKAGLAWIFILSLELESKNEEVDVGPKTLISETEGIPARLQFTGEDLAANRAGVMSPAQISRARNRAIKTSLFVLAWIFFEVAWAYLMLSFGGRSTTGEPNPVGTFGIILLLFFFGLLTIPFVWYVLRMWQVVQAGVVKAVEGKVTFNYVRKKFVPIRVYPFFIQYLVMRDKQKHFMVRPVSEDLFKPNVIYRVYYAPLDPIRILSIERKT